MKTQAEYSREWYQKNKKRRCELNNKLRKKRIKWFKELKSTLSCEICGEDFIECLEFHHLDPKTKYKNVSTMPHECHSEKSILEEIKKCQVLCANGHRKVKYGIVPGKH